MLLWNKLRQGPCLHLLIVVLPSLCLNFLKNEVSPILSKLKISFHCVLWNQLSRYPAEEALSLITSVLARQCSNPLSYTNHRVIFPEEAGSSLGKDALVLHWDLSRTVLKLLCRPQAKVPVELSSLNKKIKKVFEGRSGQSRMNLGERRRETQQQAFVSYSRDFSPCTSHVQLLLFPILSSRLRWVSYIRTPSPSQIPAQRK